MTHTHNNISQKPTILLLFPILTPKSQSLPFAGLDIQFIQINPQRIHSIKLLSIEEKTCLEDCETYGERLGDLVVCGVLVVTFQD